MKAFVIAYAATVLALLGTIWTGRAGRRPVHFSFVGALLVALTIAVYYADLLGRSLVFEGSSGTVHSLHLVTVGIALLFLAATLLSGMRLARSKRRHSERRRLHGRSAWAFVAGILTATAFGVAMTMLAVKA